MRAGSRLPRLEDQAQQQRAVGLAQNTEWVQEALTLLSWADLSKINEALSACPWDDLPPGLPEDTRAACTWATAIHTRTVAQVWPRPPTGAAQVFEWEAAKVEDPARVAWLVMA